MAFTARGSILVTQEGSDLPKPLSPKNFEIFSCEGPEIFCGFSFSSHFPCPLRLIQII